MINDFGVIWCQMTSFDAINTKVIILSATSSVKWRQMTSIDINWRQLTKVNMTSSVVLASSWTLIDVKIWILPIDVKIWILPIDVPIDVKIYILLTEDSNPDPQLLNFENVICVYSGQVNCRFKKFKYICCFME